jgi:DNA-binding response OmpR family regulator
MPGMSGYEVLLNLKENPITQSVPIIFISANTSHDDEAKGLELGAMDYITKPFSPREVVARIKAILRRCQTDAKSNDSISFGKFMINKEEHYIKYKDKIIELTPKEFSLLWHLAQNPKKVFKRENLLKAVWGYDYFGDVRTVDTHIKSLRKKLGEAAEAIETVWGVGYKFEAKKLKNRSPE